MIVMVAVRTGTKTSLAHSPGRLGLRHLPVQELDVVVGNHDGVVHHDAEDHDEPCDGDLMQGNPDRVHDPEGAAQGHRYGQSCDEGDPQGKKYDGDDDHRNDRQQKFVAQRRQSAPSRPPAGWRPGPAGRRGEGAP